MQNAKVKIQKVVARTCGVLCLHLAFCMLNSSILDAQQLLDRVLARIGTEAITQTDVEALVEFGLIEARSPTVPAAVQQAIGTREASLRSLKAGMDMLCIGNNLFDQEQEMAAIAEYVGESLRDGALSGPAIGKSVARVAKRKVLLAAGTP